MHLMIDLETLGTDTNCVVTQLGYCLFEMQTGNVVFSDEIHLDPQEQLDLGRTVSWDTICWWNKQNSEAKENMFGEGGKRISLISAINSFEYNVEHGAAFRELEGVWSHGLTFDVAIMSSLYELYGKKEPWKYNIPRDTRTIFALVPDMTMEKPLVPHSAMSDAIAQAHNVAKAMRYITVNKEL